MSRVRPVVTTTCAPADTAARTAAPTRALISNPVASRVPSTSSAISFGAPPSSATVLLCPPPPTLTADSPPPRCGHPASGAALAVAGLGDCLARTRTEDARDGTRRGTGSCRSAGEVPSGRIISLMRAWCTGPDAGRARLVDPDDTSLLARESDKHVRHDDGGKRLIADRRHSINALALSASGHDRRPETDSQ